MQEHNSSSNSKFHILNHQVKIYVTNGMGRSGKDTFAQYITEKMKQEFPIITYGCEHFQKLSCVEWPKEVCKYAGWDGFSKEEKDRKFISDVNLALETWDNSPLQKTLDKINNFWRGAGVKYFFVDIREPYRIQNFRVMCEEYNYQFATIFIRRPGITQITSNNGDRATLEPFDYDYYINNNGTLEDLKKKAEDFVMEVMLK